LPVTRPVAASVADPRQKSTRISARASDPDARAS
jgi:hypothetical protein